MQSMMYPPTQMHPQMSPPTQMHPQMSPPTPHTQQSVPSPFVASSGDDPWPFANIEVYF